MGRRSKSDELGLDQRIVEMHDTEKMTHSEISEQFKGEGIDLSREAVRRSYQNSMRQAGRYRIAAESCRQIMETVKDGSNLDMVEAITSILTGKLYDQIMEMDDLGIEDPKDLIKAITSTGSAQVKIAQFRLNFNKGVEKAKAVILDEFAEKLSDRPDLLDEISGIVRNIEVKE